MALLNDSQATTLLDLVNFGSGTPEIRLRKWTPFLLKYGILNPLIYLGIKFDAWYRV